MSFLNARQWLFYAKAHLLNGPAGCFLRKQQIRMECMLYYAL